ncbi:MAG: alanine-zipper protein [Candidatus Binatia bacterium]
MKAIKNATLLLGVLIVFAGCAGMQSMRSKAQADADTAESVARAEKAAQAAEEAAKRATVAAEKAEVIFHKSLQK